MNPRMPRTAVAPTAEQRIGYEQFVVSVGDIKNQAPDLPRRYGIFGPEGSGKTSLSAGAPHCIFITGRGETGLQTLMSAGRVPRTPFFKEALDWEYVLACIRFLHQQKHEYAAVVFDTINIMESLLHAYVCKKHFDGDMTRSGFLSYNAGYEVALEPLREFLSMLDQLRVDRKIAILFLGHTRIRTFKNPEGPDYDRYVVDVHEKTWGLIHRWLDVVGFISFETAVTEVQKTGVGKKGKGFGGSRRVMHTERTAAYDAKNRLGLAEHIDLGDDPAVSWQHFAEAIREARAASAGQEAKEAKEEVREELKEQTQEAMV